MSGAGTLTCNLTFPNCFVLQQLVATKRGAVVQLCHQLREAEFLRLFQGTFGWIQLG